MNQATLSIKELLQMYEANVISPVDITQQILEHVNLFNPEINSLITITAERALEEAKVAEKKWREGNATGLCGIPITYKDNIDIQGVRSTNGSLAFKNNIACHNADIVNVFKEQGAVTIGKAHLYEFAFGITSVNPSYGPAINPLNPKLIAGGSSSGSATSVAAKFCSLSIGTDTAGSIRVPAACCGVVGFKPTYSTWSMKGIFPLSPSMDHAGPIATSVEDIWLTMQAYRKQTLSIPNVTLKGVKIGVPTFSHSIKDDVKDVWQSATQLAEKEGASLIPFKFPDKYEFLNVAHCVASTESGIPHVERDTTQYSIPVLKALQKSRNQTAHAYILAQESKTKLQFQVDKLFEDIDVLLMPVMPTSPPLRDQERIYFIGDDQDEKVEEVLIWLTSLFNLTGHPALSLPYSKEAGTPVGLQLIGKRGADQHVLEIGLSLEEVL